jgi:PAS domain-containing protein
MIGRLSTIPRLSLGLVSLTVTLILAAELLGLLPDQQKAVLETRAKIAEVLAVEVSSAAARNDFNLVQTILTSTVAREDTMLSAALRDKDGGIVAAAGNHQENWEPAEDGRSTPTHVQVPIQKKQADWGAVEISFTPLQSFTSLDGWKNSSLGLLAFVTITGFVLFFLYLRRALRELDPSAVIPAHVKSAFDALAEGVLIIDEKEHIVLANEAFAAVIEQPASSLTGRKASELNWLSSETGGATGILPWQRAMTDGKVHAGIALSRESAENGVRTFIVNGAPIRDGKGNVRGAWKKPCSIWPSPRRK